MKQEILLPFLQKYTSARPFVMHQNKYEQIDDINRRYIKLYIYDFFRRSDKLKSALMKVDFHMSEAVEYFEKKREEQKTTPVNKEKMQEEQKTTPVNKEKEWVNHPLHYNPGVYETINVIDAYNLNFYLATALRYILRAGKKHPEKYCEDLSKAIWYLNREIKNNSRS